MTSLRPAAASLALLTLVSASLANANTGSAEIEARIEALNSEMEMLQEQLERQRVLERTSQVQGEGERQADEFPPEVERELTQRRQLERESTRNPFSLTTHRLNYVLPFSHTSNPNTTAFRDVTDASSPDDIEVKFQVSAKFNLVEDIFGNNGDLYFAYTQRSWWQAYNTDASSPFRETNYEPEVFLDFDSNWSLLGWTNINNRIYFNHQSNGRSDPLSRSWNRLILESAFIRGDWAVSVAPHWRIPESDGDDDNPDIERYMGYGDITVAHRIGNDHEASLMVRGNPSAGNMGTQINYTWPLFGNVRGMVQYHYGYGESMIDYDQHQHRFSVGFSLNPLFTTSERDR
ncbi:MULTISPECIES: phospholipase A [Halomonadaceae]|uniref:phospholipase A n=1 Tax=Halomonadaceae TaxID=28256 RepID=UPI00159A8992|nr:MULTISPECIES: phospholipase A [Halomonas]QJQ94942.1 phospholipase [Halomonas sp. PA5]